MLQTHVLGPLLVCYTRTSMIQFRMSWYANAAGDTIILFTDNFWEAVVNKTKFDLTIEDVRVF